MELVKIENNEVVVSSREVAKNFEKRHDHVLRDIRILLESLPNFGDTSKMFHKTTYINEQNHQEYQEYLMNRDGFSLLVMGFTGKEALEWKLKYINAFNEMEKKLKEIKPQLSTIEIKLKEKELEVREKELKYNALLGVLNNVDIPEYKQILNSLIVKEVSGKEYLPLPECNKKMYTATEIADMFGVSSQKVGKVANQLGLKTDTYCKRFFDKARNSNKEVITYRYFENALERFREIFVD